MLSGSLVELLDKFHDVDAMLTKRTQTRPLTVGNEVMSVSTMPAPEELHGKTVEQAARMLRPESLIAIIDETGETIMVVDLILGPAHHRTIRPGDKLLICTNIH